jgi:hypothetical protein
VLGGLLGGVPDVVSARGVELRARFWHEPDAERAPHREDDRIAPGRQLPAGLGDRLPGQVGAVVGEQHRTRAVGVRMAGETAGTGCQRRGEPAAAVHSGDSRGRGRGQGRPDLAGAEGSQQRRRVPGRILTAHPPAERRSGQRDPAQHVEQDSDDRTARGEAEADPQGGVHRAGRQAGQRRTEVQQDRHDHERCHGAQQFQDREHALYRRGAERETGQEQRRGHRRADADADQP